MFEFLHIKVVTSALIEAVAFNTKTPHLISAKTYLSYLVS